MAKKIKAEDAKLSCVIEGPPIPGDPGDEVIAFLATFIAMAQRGEATIEGISFNTRHAVVSFMPCEVGVNIRCEKFPNFGGHYGRSDEDAVGFAESMIDFWTRRIEQLNASIKREGERKAAEVDS